MGRLSVNINDETATALRQSAQDKETSVTEIVRRAVSVYEFFDDAKREGKKIQLVSQDGTATRVEML